MTEKGTQSSTIAFSERVHLIYLGVVIRQLLHELTLWKAPQELVARQLGELAGRVALDVLWEAESCFFKDLNSSDLPCPVKDIAEYAPVEKPKMDQVERPWKGARSELFRPCR